MLYSIDDKVSAFLSGPEVLIGMTIELSMRHNRTTTKARYAHLHGKFRYDDVSATPFATTGRYIKCETLLDGRIALFPGDAPMASSQRANTRMKSKPPGLYPIEGKGEKPNSPRSLFVSPPHWMPVDKYKYFTVAKLIKCNHEVAHRYKLEVHQCWCIIFSPDPQLCKASDGLPITKANNPGSYAQSLPQESSNPFIDDLHAWAKAIGGKVCDVERPDGTRTIGVVTSNGNVLIPRTPSSK